MSHLVTEHARTRLRMLQSGFLLAVGFLVTLTLALYVFKSMDECADRGGTMRPAPPSRDINERIPHVHNIECRVPGR